MNNPIVERYRYSLLRPGQVWVMVTVYLLAVGILLFINASIYPQKSVD